MKSDPSNIMIAMFLWAIPLLVPVLTTYFSDAYFKVFLFTAVFPIIIGILSRTSRFWVNQTAILYAGLAAIITGFLIIMNKKNKEAIENPKSNRLRSALLYAALIGSFLLVLGMSTMFLVPLYDGKDFTPGSGNNVKGNLDNNF
tara:strand:+ start:161 stop:592 length:432 start_codon:yes stop_codon:yes gene_type:complete